jgi:hypothetical protein
MESPPLAILTFPHDGIFAGIFFMIFDDGRFMTTDRYRAILEHKGLSGWNIA